MRYTHSINAVKCLEWDINLAQGALFDLLNQASSWAEPTFVDGLIFYWVSRNKVVTEIPVAYNKPDTVYRSLRTLADKGLIVYIKDGKKDLMRLTEKGKTWNVKGTVLGDEKLGNKSELDENSEINPSKLGNKSEAESEINPTYKNTSINKNTKDKSTDCSLLNSNQKLNDADAQNPDPSLSNTFNSNVDNKADDFTFEQFWEMYDRKIERKKCEAKFSKLTSEVKGLIKATLPKYVEITKDGRPQRKHPSTYLNNECWNDDLSALAFNDAPASGTTINTYHPSHTPAARIEKNTTVEQDQRNKEIGMQKAAQLKSMLAGLQKGQSL